MERRDLPEQVRRQEPASSQDLDPQETPIVIQVEIHFANKRRELLR